MPSIPCTFFQHAGGIIITIVILKKVLFFIQYLYLFVKRMFSMLHRLQWNVVETQALDQRRSDDLFMQRMLLCEPLYILKKNLIFLLHNSWIVRPWSKIHPFHTCLVLRKSPQMAFCKTPFSCLLQASATLLVYFVMSCLLKPEYHFFWSAVLQFMSVLLSLSWNQCFKGLFAGQFLSQVQWLSGVLFRKSLCLSKRKWCILTLVDVYYGFSFSWEFHHKQLLLYCSNNQTLCFIAKNVSLITWNYTKTLIPKCKLP